MEIRTHEMPDPVEDYGQRTDHTCAVACLRYVLRCHSINLTEEQLLGGVIEEREDGNSTAEVAEAAHRLGFVPCVRCLQGYRHLIEGVRDEWVQEGEEEELEEWLRRIVKERKPVIVSLDTRQLQPPYDPLWGGPHSVVVLNIRGDTVEFLEPDPPQQKSYPKQGQCMFVDFETFMKAWRSVACIALLVSRS